MTVGFTGKFFVFFGAMSVRGASIPGLYPTLALIGVVNAAIGAWYCLLHHHRHVLAGSVKPIETFGTIPGLAALVICIALTLLLAIPAGTTWVLYAARQTTARPAVAQPQAMNALVP